MSDKRYATTVFGSVDDVPPPPAGDTFAISGLSVVLYFAHRVDAEALQDAFEEGRLLMVKGDNSYLEKVRADSQITQSRLTNCGTINLTHRTRVALGHSILWMGGEYALSTVPIVHSTGDLHVEHHILLDRALSLDETLASIRTLTARAVLDQLSTGVSSSLKAVNVPTLATWFLRDNLALQVWNLDGTAGRGGSKLYEGLAETRRFAWEISALLAVTSDHILVDGLWRKRSSDAVFSELGTGFTFFTDHIVLANETCCLEMTHLPAWLRERSRFRLQSYGYDSSSIFVWTVAMLRSAATAHLAAHYRTELIRLAELDGMTAQEETELTRQQFMHAALSDRLSTFRGALKEPRNRAFDAYVSNVRGDDRALTMLARDMEKATALASSLARLREQKLQASTSVLLGVLAVALAVASVPQIVDQYDDWIQKHEWPQLITSTAVMAVLLGVLPQVWKRGR